MNIRALLVLLVVIAAQSRAAVVSLSNYNTTPYQYVVAFRNPDTNSFQGYSCHVPASSTVQVDIRTDYIVSIEVRSANGLTLILNKSVSLTLSPKVGAFFSLIIRSSVDYSYWGTYPVTDDAARDTVNVWPQVNWDEFVSGMAAAMVAIGGWWVYRVFRRAGDEASAD